MKTENRKIIRPGRNEPSPEGIKRWRESHGDIGPGDSAMEMWAETMRMWAEEKNMAGFQEMLEYSDDFYMSTVVDYNTWIGMLGGGAADPCLAWLVKEGWISEDSFSNPEMIDFLAEIWKMGCQNALASQELEGTVLNFRGAEILRVFSEWEQQITEINRRGHRNGEMRILKNPRKEKLPMGPGFDKWILEFEKWAEDISQLDLEILSTWWYRALWPSILKNTKTAGSDEGVKALVKILDARYPTIIFSLYENKYLDKNNPELVEWALAGIKDKGEQINTNVKVFWLRFHQDGHKLSLEIMEKLRDDISKNGAVRGHAWIPDIYEDPTLKSAVLQSDSRVGWVSLFYVRGKEWVETAKEVDEKKLASERNLLDTIRMVRPEQLVGLTRQDLVPLMQSKSRGVRAEAIRILREIEEPAAVIRAETSGRGI